MKKDFDCVEMKHKAAVKIHKKLSVLSIVEEEKFWEDRSEKMKAEKYRHKTEDGG